MKSLGITEILAIDDLPVSAVEVPFWKQNGEAVCVHIRPLNALQKSEIEGLYGRKEPSPGVLRERLFLMSLCNQDGSPLLDGNTVKLFMEKSAAATDVIFRAISELNAFGEKELEEIEKN